MAFTRFLLRRDTASAWTLRNPVLGAGEPGFELPSADFPAGRMKIGDGVSAWSTLPYQGNVVVGPTNKLTGPGIWVQTGLGDGTDFTIWIEDGQ